MKISAIIDLKHINDLGQLRKSLQQHLGFSLTIWLLVCIPNIKKSTKNSQDQDLRPLTRILFKADKQMPELHNQLISPSYPHTPVSRIATDL
jgi:hypothetical protein